MMSFCHGFFFLFFWFCCIVHSFLVVLQSRNSWIVQEGISPCSQSSPKVRPRVSLSYSLSLSFLLCPFAKSVVTRITSKHNFIEKSLSLSVSFSSSPQFFLLFLKLKNGFCPGFWWEEKMGDVLTSQGGHKSQQWARDAFPTGFCTLPYFVTQAMCIH